MNSFPTHIDAVRRALASHQTTAHELLAHAQSVASSSICRHAFMPGGYEPVLPAVATGALAGVMVSVKDLFDVAGQITRAGSTVLNQNSPAAADCPAVARLRAAGAVLTGRTNMVEFAFSAVGINPHYGTPVNPADTHIERIPGGSSSGAAVSVATGAALVGLGSDTGGSIRIPAALCGIVGFKSTARLVPADGAVPLSASLDTVCAVTRSVGDAITVHEVLAARTVRRVGKPLTNCRFAVAKTLMQDSLESAVASAFEASLQVLSKAGAHIEQIDLSELNELASINATGGLSAAESYAWHRKLIAERQAEYDPRVALRILRGRAMTASEYIDLLAARASWIIKINARLHGFDAVLSPTVPMIAPAIASVLNDDAEFFRVNGLLLRNTSVVNMLDGCAITLPSQAGGTLPVGLMLWHAALQDDNVLSAALQVEAALCHAL